MNLIKNNQTLKEAVTERIQELKDDIEKRKAIDAEYWYVERTLETNYKLLAMLMEKKKRPKLLVYR